MKDCLILHSNEQVAQSSDQAPALFEIVGTIPTTCFTVLIKSDRIISLDILIILGTSNYVKSVKEGPGVKNWIKKKIGLQ